MPSGGILIVDQLERLYEQCDSSRQRLFLDVLRRIEGEQVKVVVGLRADYYHLALEHGDLGRRVSEAQIVLRPMGEQEMREAIRKPAEGLYRFVQPELVHQLIHDVSGRAGDLPLLQFTLLQLWQKDANKGGLTLESYRGLGGGDKGGDEGGIAKLLIDYAEGVREDLPYPDREILDRIFHTLCSAASPDSEGVRTSSRLTRRAKRSEWGEGDWGIVKHLVDKRLLTSSTSDRSDRSGDTVEVAHEALIRVWPRLQSWRTRTVTLSVGGRPTTTRPLLAGSPTSRTLRFCCPPRCSIRRGTTLKTTSTGLS